MGKNELGKVFNLAGRSCLFFLSFGQSHFKHTKTILITEKNLLKITIRNEKTANNNQDFVWPAGPRMKLLLHCLPRLQMGKRA